MDCGGPREEMGKTEHHEWGPALKIAHNVRCKEGEPSSLNVYWRCSQPKASEKEGWGGGQAGVVAPAVVTSCQNGISFPSREVHQGEKSKKKATNRSGKALYYKGSIMLVVHGGSQGIKKTWGV